MARYCTNASSSSCAARCNDVIRCTSTFGANDGPLRRDDVTRFVPTANAYSGAAGCNVSLCYASTARAGHFANDRRANVAPTALCAHVRNVAATSVTVGVFSRTAKLQYDKPAATTA